MGTYYHTGWLPAPELPLKVNGLNLDAVYENFVRQIAGCALPAGNGESLKESIERQEKRRLLEKQIAALQAKVRKEKQLNIQMRLNAELKEIKKQMEGIQNR